MRLPLVVATVLMALASSSAWATPAAKAVSKEDILKAIVIFQRDPTGTQGQMVSPMILHFAEATPDAQIVVSPKRMPWIENNAVSKEVGGLLIVAYMAGDIQAQFDHHQAKDDPVAATRQVVATYRFLQRRDAKLKIPQVEKLISLDRDHKLAGYFAADK